MLEQNQSNEQPALQEASQETKSLIEQQRSLAEALGERGEVDVVLMVDDKPANTVRIAIK